MLSILIPTYNYNIYSLVEELEKQCKNIDINFEILCQDDCSNSLLNTKNKEIKLLHNCFFFINETNIGRGKNLNSLVTKAKFEWILFLDCDTFPTKDNFIKNYIETAYQNDLIVFGGIVYKNKKPERDALLRWIYGQKREALSLSNRNKRPNFSALTSNLLIKKEIFSKYPFDDSITKYGYEDLCFFAVLNNNHFEVKHIENPTYHLDLETSNLFLKKTRTALENLNFLEKSNKISEKESKIIVAYQKLDKLKLTPFIAFIFSKIQLKIETNLLSENPSLFWFDIYKLGYYCQLKSSK
ncbi:glycosyltransferase family 2 protein [Flavobacterium sp. WC2509]|uniref:glycosyltransferase family 2 protein n=1 Tax=Flavobacterium sp. WC2509 TaxID=3461406 RepID=UPI004044D395